MRALKTIVIGLGIVLVVGFGLLIYGLTQNWHRLARTPPAGPGLSAAWGNVALHQSPAARVRSMSAVGNHLILHIAEGEGERERLIVVEPASGAVVGTFWLAEAP